jgi:hypothetical protein
MSRSELWRRRLEEQRASGETITSYCRRSGISKSSFEYWRGKLAVAVEQSKKEGTGRFVPVGVGAEGITIEHGGTTIRLSTTEHLGAVLEILHALA